jgi:hypothetical protein
MGGIETTVEIDRGNHKNFVLGGGGGGGGHYDANFFAAASARAAVERPPATAAASIQTKVSRRGAPAALQRRTPSGLARSSSAT